MADDLENKMEEAINRAVLTPEGFHGALARAHVICAEIARQHYEPRLTLLADQLQRGGWADRDALIAVSEAWTAGDRLAQAVRDHFGHADAPYTPWALEALAAYDEARGG